MKEIIILIIVFAVLSTLVVFIRLRKALYQEKNKLSFKESMDLAECPVVTLYNNGRKFNFLLDTGSNYSHVGVRASKNLIGEFIADNNVSTTGYTGEADSQGSIKAELTYRNNKFEEVFFVSPTLDNAFKCIKETTGVKVHGLLGAKFFQKYKYILDFATLTAYPKK